MDAEQRDESHALVGVSLSGTDARTVSGNNKRRNFFIAGGVGLVALATILITTLTLTVPKQSSMVCEKSTGEFNITFFVVGDWGREGNQNQKAAADLMAAVANCHSPEFIISTGDNFYQHGLQGPDDPQFATSFSRVYTADSLAVPWHAVLGNHDYGDGLPALCDSVQLHNCSGSCCYSPSWQYAGGLSPSVADPRWHCSNGSHAMRGLGGGVLDLVLFDTSPYIDRYHEHEWAHQPGGISSQNLTLLSQQIQADLAAPSPAAWKLAVGHHPVASYGGHGQEGDTQYLQHLGQWLEAYGAAAYFCGHEHDLQHIRRTGGRVHYVVSGAGSDTRPGEFDSVDDTPGLNYATESQGFVSVRVGSNTLNVQFFTTAHGPEHPEYEFTVRR